MARVFVCIPTHNRADYVKLAIDSLAGQTNGDFRALVSDDASDADAAREVERYVSELDDERFSYVHHAENLQEFGHIRFMHGECREPYFAILHDDDLWEPAFLEDCLAVLAGEDDSVPFVTAGQYLIDETGARRTDWLENYERSMGRFAHAGGRVPILEQLLETAGFFTLSSSLFRAAALNRCGVSDPECHGNGLGDFGLFVRLGERYREAFYLARPLAAYRIHKATQLSGTEYAAGFRGRLMEVFVGILERRTFEGRAERARRRQLAAAYHNMAIISRFRGDWGAMYRHIFLSVRTNPQSWRNWAYWCFVVLTPFLIKPVFKGRVHP